VDTSAERGRQLRAALERAFAPGEIDVIDDSAAHAGHAGAREGGHYRVRIVSDRFAGRSTLERHRLVYDAVGALMGRGVHALNIRALAPGEAG
jgi:BolA family transcriptional regulator, general stress-responsive regulator